MIIDWMAFVTVVVTSLVAGCLLVTLFSVALRVGDGDAAWRRPVSVALYALCAIEVLVGVFLIVPQLRGLVGL
jgi:uncharacterized membrane protein